MIAYVLKKYVIKLKETNYRYLRGLLWNYYHSSRLYAMAHTNQMGLSYTSVKRHTSVHSITGKPTLGELIYWVRVAVPKAERVQSSQLVEGHYQKNVATIRSLYLIGRSRKIPDKRWRVEI